MVNKIKKRIELVHFKPSKLKNDFGNPRTITKKALEDLKKSITELGDFGVITIDSELNVISGNQRLKAMLELGIDIPIACKQLIGYTEKEKKAINVKANISSGEWDHDVLDDWMDDLQEFDYVGLDSFGIKEDDIKESEIDLLETENKCPSCGYEW